MRRFSHSSTLLYLCLISCGLVSLPALAEKNAVAVFDLENMTPHEPATANMGELLSGQVIDVLKEAKHIVVERERLILALEELKLGSGALADPSTRLQVGKIVGARHMVFGTYLIIGGVMRLDLRLVDVETGGILSACERSTSNPDPAEWMRLTREVAKTLF